MKGNSIKMTMDRIDQKEQNDAKKTPSPPPPIKNTLYFSIGPHYRIKINRNLLSLCIESKWYKYTKDYK